MIRRTNGLQPDVLVHVVSGRKIRHLPRTAKQNQTEIPRMELILRCLHTFFRTLSCIKILFFTMLGYSLQIYDTYKKLRPISSNQSNNILQ